MSSLAYDRLASTDMRRRIAAQALFKAEFSVQGRADHSLNAAFRVFQRYCIGADLCDVQPVTQKILADEDFRSHLIVCTGLGYLRSDYPCILPAALLHNICIEFGDRASLFFQSQLDFGSCPGSVPVRSEVEALGSAGVVRWISSLGKSDASWIRFFVRPSGSTGVRLLDMSKLADLATKAFTHLGGVRNGDN